MNIEYLKISRRVGLIDLIKAKGYKTGVEVGTDRGGYAKDICDRYPEFKLYTMDPYLPYNEGSEIKTAEDMNNFWEEASNILSKYSNCTFLPMKTSKEVALTFEDNSIDFIFIDGNHEYEGVKEDLELWYSKIKPGGMMSGHDYVNRPDRKYGVIKAVNEFVEENKIDPLYVLRKGTFTDCWMFFKI